MTFKQHIKETIKLALPVSIGQFGHIMIGNIDAIMVGRLGEIPLAAAALVNSLFFLILVLGIGMSVAITPLTAIAHGENNDDQCGVILRQGLIVNMLFAFLLTAVSWFVADLVYYLDQPPEVAVYAQSYLKIISISMIPFMLFQVYRQFVEGLSDTVPPMVISLAAIGVNTFFNWIYIYGNLGAPAMGLDGAGYASLITRVLMALGMMGWVIWHPKYKKYDPSFKFRSLNFPVMKRVLNIGIPSGFQWFFEVGAFSLAVIMIGWIGSTEQAAHQIAISLAAISYMIILGISTASTVRVGNSLGMKDPVRLRRAGFSAIGFGVALMAFFGILFILFNHLLPQIYIDEADVIKTASGLIIIAAAFQIFDGGQAVSIGVLRGIEDVYIPMIIGFIAYWIIALPAGYFFGFVLNYGVYGVWFGLTLGLACVAVSLIIRFNKKSRTVISAT